MSACGDAFMRWPCQTLLIGTTQGCYRPHGYMHGLVKSHLLVDRSESVDELIASFPKTVSCCEMMWNFFRQETARHAVVHQSRDRCCLLLQSCPSRQTKMKAFTAVFAEPDLWERSPRSLESSRCWWWRRLAWR